jgi:hypothetical protein
MLIVAIYWLVWLWLWRKRQGIFDEFIKTIPAFHKLSSQLLLWYLNLVERQYSRILPCKAGTDVSLQVICTTTRLEWLLRLWTKLLDQTMQCNADKHLKAYDELQGPPRHVIQVWRRITQMRMSNVVGYTVYGFTLQRNHAGDMYITESLFPWCLVYIMSYFDAWVLSQQFLSQFNDNF